MKVRNKFNGETLDIHIVEIINDEMNDTSCLDHGAGVVEQLEYRLGRTQEVLAALVEILGEPVARSLLDKVGMLWSPT